MPSESPSLDPLFHEDAHMRSLLPMLYVAWADGVLESAELEHMRQVAQALPWMQAEHHTLLKQWLDPKAPPHASELQSALALIRDGAAGLAPGERRSLAEMGLSIVAQRDRNAKEIQPGSATWKALRDIEMALGVVSAERARELLQDDDAASPEGFQEAPATFDVQAMQSLLNQPYAEVRDRVRAFLSSPEMVRDFDLPKEEQRAQVLDWLKKLSKDGLAHVAYPGVTSEVEDLGAFIATFQTLAFFDQSLVVKFGVQLGLFGGSLYFLGTDKHRHYLPDIADMKLLGCFAMTERGHGSNVRGLQTTAVFDPETDSFIIHTPTEAASKEWIGNAAAHGHMATVFAQLETQGQRHGVHAFLVPIRNQAGDVLPGVKIMDCGHKMGLNGVDNGRLWFDQVKVPRDNLLDRFGQVDEKGNYSSPISSKSRRFFTMLGTLVAGRVSVASAGLSAAKVGLTIATRYGAGRRQFGPSGKPEMPVLNYRAHQRRLMPLLARTYALEFALQDLQRRYVKRDEGGEDEVREIEAIAAGLKSLSTWHTNEALQVSREACGGQGYLTDNIISQLRLDTDVYATFEGDNTVLLQLVAKARLGAWRQQFMDDKVFGVLRYIAQTAGAALTERNPFTVRQTDAAHLRDLDFIEQAFRYRDEDLARTLAGRLKRRLDQGMDAFDAFNDCQDHVLSLAEAWTERVILESFMKAVKAQAESSLAEPLGLLCQLYGLHTIEKHMGWFLENGTLSPAKASAVRQEVNSLCFEVRQQALPLLEAFDIPDSCLDAPILSWGSKA